MADIIPENMPEQMFGVGMLLTELSTNIGAAIPASSFDDGCLGFLPVYKTEEQAKKAYPLADIIPIKKGRSNG